MVSKARISCQVIAIIVILTSITGTFWFDVFGAEFHVDKSTGDRDNLEVYLPLVIHPEPPSVPPILDFEEQVVVLTNQERLSHGCGPVTMDSRLREAAEGHSKDMAVNDYFSHYAPDGTSPWERIRAQDYFYTLAGENIAVGYSSPELVVAGWMDSPGHRENILNCGFIHIGVGYYDLPDDTGSVNYRHYWTQVFASP
ncbi:CAP domain-containing protein [Chloroflexota bacterium]